MKPVFQTIVDTENGDCTRAAVASMFELDITQVPNFVMFDDDWWTMLNCFLWGLGYELKYWVFYDTIKFNRKYLINGAIMASVPSKTFKNVSHTILCNSRGRVIHDPNPNKAWLGEYVTVPDAEDNGLDGWYVIEKRKKNGKKENY